MGAAKTCPVCGSIYMGRRCPGCPPEPGTETAAEPIGSSFHRLEVLGPLGKGGMGSVYRARQPGTGRVVALKILDPGRSESFRMRFEREAKVLASLAHPRVVTLHDYGQEDGICFLVMELVAGGSLRDHLARGPLPPAEAVRIAVEVCEGLEFAHGLGVVHRDIKPENLLLDAQGRVKIADFGLARLVETETTARLTQTGAVLGTMRYMAPEQLDRPDAVDARADVYSVGVVLYEMLAGAVPMGAFRSPSTDGRLNAIVTKALDPDPERRFASARELREALQAKASPARRRRLLPLAAVPLALVALTALLLPGGSTPVVRWPPAPVPDFAQALSDAAAIEPADWSRMLRPPNARSGSSLTAILLSQPPGEDVEFTHSSLAELRRALERSGRISILQPEDLRIDVEAGVCRFESAAFRGSVQFRIEGGRVVEFRCPRGGDVTRRHGDGWKAEVAPRRGLAALLPGVLEAPLGADRRDAVWARTAGELESVANRFHALLVARDTVPAPTGLTSAFAVRWGDCDLIAFECPNPAGWEHIVFRNYPKRAYWTHVTETAIVAAFVRRDVARTQFLDLVHRLQRRFGLPYFPPPFPWWDAVFNPEELPVGWKHAEADPGLEAKLPFASPADSWKEQVLRSPRGIPGVSVRDLGHVYCAVLENSQNRLDWTVWEFQSVEAACRAERRLRSDPPWPRTRRIEILRARHALAVVLANSDADPVTAMLRRRMGFSPQTLESIQLAPNELPDGCREVGREDRPEEAIRALGLEKLCPAETRAVLQRLSSDVRIAYLETEEAPALAKRIGERHRVVTSGRFLAFVAQGDPSFDVCLQGKLGLPIVRAPGGWTAAATLRGHGKRITSAVPADGRVISASEDATIRIWEGGTESRRIAAPGPVLALALGESWLAGAVSDRTVRFWNPVTGREDGTPIRLRDRALCLAAASGLLVTGGNDFRIRLWNVADRKERVELPQQVSHVLSIAFRSDEEVFATATWDRKIKLWNASTGQELRVWIGHESGFRIHQIALRPDGSILASAGADRVVRFWNPEKGEAIRTPLGHPEEVLGIAFSPDGRLLASACLDGLLRIFDVDGGRLVEAKAAHEKGALTVAFSKDGRTIVTSGADDLVRVWSLE